MLQVKKFVLSPFAVNTYIVYDLTTKETAVIDPGCLSPEEEKAIESYVNENELKVKYLINTHCHLDHIFGNAFIKETYNCDLYIPKGDEFLLDLMVEHAAGYGVEMKPSPKPDKYLDDTDFLNLGENVMIFLFTPGHSPGEFSIYFEKAKLCITGDVLFQEGIGRTDLWEGDYRTLINSIKEKLFVLPDDVTIYPGHGEESTIGSEKISNPFLVGD